MKPEYQKKIRNKSLTISVDSSTPDRQLGYYQAMSLVKELRDRGKPELSQGCLQQICAQLKSVPEPAVILLETYLAAMQIDRAQELVDRLLRKFPRDNTVLRYCARFYQAALDPDQAIALVSKAVALYPKSADNYQLLGLLHRSLGSAEQALLAFDESLRRNPAQTSALLEKANILGPHADPAFIHSLEERLATEGLDPTMRASLHFALSRCYEQSDFDRSFCHLDEANELVAASRPFLAAESAAAVTASIDRFSSPWLAVTTGVSDSTRSPIFIAALPRSGTTLLEQMLAGHSALYALGESSAFHLALKEERATGNPLLALGRRWETEPLAPAVRAIAARFEDNYFVRRAGKSRTVDKSMENYADIGLILTVYPQARVIDLQRHPLAVIYSCYRQHFTSGNSFAYQLQSAATKYVHYHRLMEHWRSLYRGSLFSLSYEQLISSPEQVLRELLDFCGLEWEAGCLSPGSGTGLINTASDAQVRKALHADSIAAWRRADKYLAPAKAVLEEAGIEWA